MSARLVVTGLVMIGAAALGCWVFSDAAPVPAPPTPNGFHDVEPTPVKSGPDQKSDRPQFSAGEIIEVIDLSRVFEPTGDELDLQRLLAGLDQTEFLPMPRLVAPEQLPFPRLVDVARLPEAGEEASSPPGLFESIGQELGWAFRDAWSEVRELFQPSNNGPPSSDDDLP